MVCSDPFTFHIALQAHIPIIDCISQPSKQFQKIGQIGNTVDESVNDCQVVPGDVRGARKPGEMVESITKRKRSSAISRLLRDRGDQPDSHKRD
jgi:hypothetical protein